MARRPLRLVFETRPFTGEWERHVRCNVPLPGWRGWLRLRRLAQRIDGVLSLGVHIHSVPALDNHAKGEVLAAGIQAMERATEDLAREGALDAALIAAFPELTEPR